MMRITPGCRQVFALIVALLVISCGQQAETWRVSELCFTASRSYDAGGGDRVRMDVRFSNQSTGRTLSIPAFWDGGDRFVVRFAPPEPGRWTWQSTCPDDPALDGRKGSLRCRKYTGDLAIYRHGFIEARKGMKYLMYADGTPFFYLGDTHWGMYTEELSDDHFKRIVRRRVEQGFTVIQSEPIGAPFHLQDGRVDAEDIAGFRTADAYYQFIADAGLLHANAEFFFPSDLSEELASDEEALQALARYWVARFGAYPVLWTLAQEIDNDFYAERGGRFYDYRDNPWVKIAAYIHAADPYSHPLSAHQENAVNTSVTGAGTDPEVALANGNGASVFLPEPVSERTGHNWWAAQWSPPLHESPRPEAVRDYWLSDRPAVNYEGRYCGLWTLNFGSRAQGWISFLSGFCGYGYGAADIWYYHGGFDANTTSFDGVEYITPEMKATPWQEALEYPSALQMRHLRALLELFDWWNLVPVIPGDPVFRDDSGAAVYARTPREHLLYFYGKGTRTGRISTLAFGAEMCAEWYDPRTGEFSEAVLPVRGDDGYWDLPAKPDEADWVLVIRTPEKKSRPTAASPKPALDCVDPFIGTGGDGHTYPGATAPFGLVQLSPDTHNSGWEAASGYRDKDTTLIGFSHTHLSGTGGVDLGDFLFTPFPEPAPFSKKDETASPGYYRIQVQDLTVELTALPRTGCQRYTFQGEGERKLWVDLRYIIGDTHPDRISFRQVSDREIEGGRHVAGWAPDRWMFFSAVFSVPFLSCESDGEDRYLLTFPHDMKELTIVVGLSPTDAEAACRNRLAEAPACDFDRILEASKALWEAQMGKVIVEGGTPAQRTNFHTALYHTLIAPNLFSDVGERPFYSTLSLWDTYRTWNPLMILLNPEMEGDMAYSLVRTFERDGKLPLWALGGVDVDCMIGYHSVSVMADAWLRGIRTFDGEKALEAMVRSSNLDPASDWYHAYGYVPSDFTPESVSKTLEFCYDDWCIARMAESLGHPDLAAEYDARALRYRNLLDPSTGFFRGKESDGNWRTPFDPAGSSRDYTEAIAWQYRHYVPHDMRGYTDLMGGPSAVLASLDSLFADENRPETVHDGNITGLMGLYAHGNEPSHGTAWLYACLGAPSESQRLVRRILEELYQPTPDGLCGNEDCGQLSAWYVLSALGLYPICPGTGEFVLGAPLFRKATVTLPNGRTLVIAADHPERPYVKEVLWNGKSLDRQFITYDELLQGGELSFRLSRKPCPDRDGLPAPYSLSKEPLVSTPYLTRDPRFFDGTFTAELLSRTPDAVIHYTLDGSEPTEASARYEGPFPITVDCILKARAFKPGCAPSPLLQSHVFPIEYLPAVTTGALQPGCRFTYHRGAFLRTAQVAASPAVERGILPAPSIQGASDEDHFGFLFSGYLDVPEAGLWEFAVTSDDGAVLEIDGSLAVNGDGSHANYTATGHIALRKGMHAFRLLYLEDYEGQNLAWAWKRPSSDTFEPIPETAIFH